MAEKRVDDEALMFDLLLGELDETRQSEARRKIEEDPQAAALHADVSNTLAALDLLGEAEPPEELVDKTLARIRQDRQLKQLIARQEATRRRPIAPTFSLRELGAVAAAAILMAVIFVPSIRSARQSMYRGECASNAGQIGTALRSFAAAGNGQFPRADGQCRWLPCSSEGSTSNSAALFQLVQNSFIKPPVFQCPAVDGGSFVLRQGMLDFPAPKYVSYSYQHAVGPQGLSLYDPAFTGKHSQMAILADRSPVFPDGKFHAERVSAQASDNHGGSGQNVLYMDGHVAWASTPTVGIGGNNIYLINGLTQYRGDESPSEPTDSFLLPAYSGR